VVGRRRSLLDTVENIASVVAGSPDARTSNAGWGSALRTGTSATGPRRREAKRICREATGTWSGARGASEREGRRFSWWAQRRGQTSGSADPPAQREPFVGEGSCVGALPR
jgi:hypothetical protein